MKTKILASILGIMCLSFTVRAQDPVFTQVMANPVYFNPAFTGIQKDFRAGLQIRDQWEGSLVTTLLTADAAFKSNSFGIMLMNDNAGYSPIITNALSFNYAYEWQFGDGLHLRLGSSLSAVNRRIDDFFTFPDGTISHFYSNKTGADLGLGGLVYTHHFYGSFSAYNIVGGLPAKPPVRLGLQTGSYFSMGRSIFNPYLMVMQQGNFIRALPGINLSVPITHEAAKRNIYLTIGASVRQTDPNTDAVNFLLGVKAGSFKICYSYDHIVSDLRSASPGSHEISLIFQLNKLRAADSNQFIQYLRRAF
jgi:type IX secretion system PorP/SprF family membrane protein